MLLRHPKDKKVMCSVHISRGVQLGSCLSCLNNAVICETKGCISHHEQNERAHNVLTIEQIRHIVSQYMNSTNQKKAYLKKMTYEYFMIARKEIQRLFTQVYQSIDHFVFDDMIFQQVDRELLNLLVEENYQQFTCEQIAVIIPKLIKSFDYEDGHFTHLKNYLIAEKQKVVSILNTSLLNMPQFRWKNPSENAFRFYEITQETLKELNTQLINLTHRPKKLRLKYIDDEVFVLLKRILKAKEFIRLLGTLQSLKDIQAIQIYCVWDVDQNEFQASVVDALLKLPYLKSISIYTGHSVTSTDFLEELIENRKDIEIKVYKKNWVF